MGIGQLHRLFGRAFRLVALLMGLLAAPLLAVASPSDREADTRIPRIDSELTAETQRRIAEQFAPLLVFHPSEQFFPTSPLFPLEHKLALTDGTDRPVSQRGASAQLGTTTERRSFYEALTPRGKANLASVYYRAYH